MKRIAFLILGVSLAGNIALVAALWRMPASHRDETGSRRSREIAADVETRGSGASRKAASSESGRPIKDLPLPAWAGLSSSDPAALVSSLRAAGLPENLVRAITIGVINEMFSEKRRAILGDRADVPFWKPRPGSLTASGREYMSKMRALSREQQQLVEQVLGADAAVSEDMRFYNNQQYGFLPAGKAELIRRIDSDYGDMTNEIMMQGLGGPRLPEDRDKLALIEKEKRSDLAAVLTPEELELFDLYRSNTANSLRYRLGAFEPTEDEFRAIYDLQRVFDEKFNPQLMIGGPMDQNLMRERQSAQQELNNQIKSVLGDERYGEFERGQDQSYRYAVKIADHFNLPRENAIAVFDLQKDIQARAAALPRPQPTPNAGSQTADQFAAAAAARALDPAFAALVQEANQKITALLTPEGLDAYKQTGGQWLRNLERGNRPPPEKSQPSAPTVIYYGP